jgi:hypothetical protein
MNGSTFFSPDWMRGDLTRLVNKFGINTDQTLVQPYLIRLEKALDAARSNYSFELLSNPGSDRETEIKLNRNDAFAVMAVRLGITKQNESVTPKQYANFPVLYNADPNYFSGAPAGQVKEFVSLEALYNSLLTIKTQNVDRVKDLATSLLKSVPNRGYITTASSSQTNAEWPEQKIGIDEFFRLMPNPILSGQENNTVNLVIGSGNLESIAGTADSAGTAVATRNVVVIEMYGYLLVDAARPAQAWNNF